MSQILFLVSKAPPAQVLAKEGLKPLEGQVPGERKGKDKATVPEVHERDGEGRRLGTALGVRKADGEAAVFFLSLLQTCYLLL